MARRKRTKKYIESQRTREKFAKTGEGQYYRVEGYTYTRPAQTIIRNGKRIHLKRKTIHVKGHLAHKPSKLK